MGLGSFFKNLFGSGKQSAENLADKAGDIADDTYAKAKEAAAPYIEKAEDYIDAFESLEHLRKKNGF